MRQLGEQRAGDGAGLWQICWRWALREKAACVFPPRALACQSLASVSPTEIIASFQGTFSSFYFVSLEGDFVNTQFLCFLKQGLLFAKKCDIGKNQGQTVSPILLFVSLLLCLSSPLLLTCPCPPPPTL